MKPFDQVLFDGICNAVADGSTLTAALEALKPYKMSRGQFLEWVELSAENVHAYARARDSLCECHFDDIANLADESHNAKTQEQAMAYKLRVEARKWLVCKLKPRKYGDKLGLEHSGQIGVHDALADALKRERELKRPDAGA